ncbi:MAG: hypothetical protein E7597_02340 [Ruminococcaceae bacterium]|nr:hypothetical protein [Oscillospiraceae bacterium]
MGRFFVCICLAFMLLGGIKAAAVTEEEIYERSGAAELEAKESTNLADKVWQVLEDAIQGFGKAAFKYCGVILACLVLLALVDNIRELRSDGTSGAALDFVSAVALSAASFPALEISFNYAKAAIEGLCVFSASLLPVMTSLYSMGGNTAQGIASAAGFGMFLTVTEAICAKLLLPLLSLGFAFALTGLLPGSTSLAPLASFVKTAACTLIAFVFTIVSFVFYFQSAISASGDNFTYRSIKFASGAFVPVIGSAVGESARTAFGAVSVVKGTVGGFGVAVMISYLLPPVVSCVLYKLCFSLCAVGARLMGLEKPAKFLTELSSLLGISLALLVGTALVFTVISAVFLKSGVTV